ncbi:hypothetical protein MmiAt1_15570 [Methanimicrococcus sp. At1]|uniref:Fibronectin type-III domain-containing protein n=1 Tax=Methanimicrococcus hacksteinii TaxID=3028293 RepID=A0ABU3VRB6_9EURY|nr:hypothetical protein [Methanimicrococcus sp. At1]MDV0445953.1 hypothetical protein [Methanimicrococcus sp. At1]
MGIIKRAKNSKILPAFLLLILIISFIPVVSAAVPDAPTNLKTTTKGLSEIYLEWTGSDNAEGYCIYRSEAVMGSYS